MLSKIIEKIENTPTSFHLWLITFLSIIVARVLMENWLAGMVSKTGDYFFHHFSYTLVFFLMAYIIFLGLLMKSLKLEIKKASNVLLWGYLIIIAPPLIDYILLKDSVYLSFYGIYGLEEMFWRFVTFFGDKPNFGITYGVRVEVALMMVFLFCYSYIKNKKILKSLCLSLAGYTILFVLGTFPSWITIITQGFSEGFMKIGEVQIVQLFFSSARLFTRETGTYLNALSIKLSIIYATLVFGLVNLGVFFYYRDKFIAFLKNARPVQLIYHGGLLVVGMGLGIFFTGLSWSPNIFNFCAFLDILIAVALAWLASVVINDIYDEKIDSITNKSRPLITKDFSKNDYMTVGVVLFGVSILFSAMVNPKVALILVAYQCLAWAYSAWPLRLKRFPIVASLVSALASILILFSGFILTSANEDISQFPARIFWLILIALVFSLPIKDLKDIQGDEADGVMTIPVIFGEYWGKIVIGGGIFISYFLSFIFLNEYKLMPWAILFGGASYFVVTFSGKNKKITNRNLIWWVLGLLTVYVAILVKIVFV